MKVVTNGGCEDFVSKDYLDYRMLRQRPNAIDWALLILIILSSIMFVVSHCSLNNRIAELETVKKTVNEEHEIRTADSDFERKIIIEEFRNEVGDSVTATVLLRVLNTSLNNIKKELLNVPTNN